MLDKQYFSKRLLPIIVAFTLALGFMIAIQQSNIYADEPTVLYQGKITNTISFKAYTDNTFVISGEGVIPRFVSWDDEAYDAVVDNKLLSSIQKIVIEEGITGIGSNAFFANVSYSFKGMKRIELPSTLESISSNAFSSNINNDMSLQEVVFSEPSSLKTIGSNAFLGCANIKELVIPEGVTKVDSYAFQGCTGLENVSFPSTITEYGASVLYGCTSMKTITFNAMNAASLSAQQSAEYGGDYAGLDGYMYNATSPGSAAGCLRKTEGHDVIMRHPEGAKGYSDDDPTPTDGWKHYVANTWKITLPEQVQSVVDAIEAIDDTVTLESEESINYARAAYDALSEENKAMIDEDTLKKLTDAEKALAGLKNINNVIALIDKIGKVTLDNEAAIDTAQNAFDALTSEQQSQVTNYNVLLEARVELAKLKLDAANDKINDLILEKDGYKNQLKQAEKEKQDALDELKAVKDEIAASKLTVSKLKVTSKAKKFTITWKRNAEADGYQVQFKLKTAKKYKTLKTLKGTKYASKKLKKGKKYIFRVRTVKKVAGKAVYGKWTKTNGVKCR